MLCSNNGEMVSLQFYRPLDGVSDVRKKKKRPTRVFDRFLLVVADSRSSQKEERRCRHFFLAFFLAVFFLAAFFFTAVFFTAVFFTAVFFTAVFLVVFFLTAFFVAFFLATVISPYRANRMDVLPLAPG